VRLGTAVVAFALLGAGGCAREAPSPEVDPTSPFALNTAVVALVQENTTDCVVDGVCALRLSFADTAVAVVYGTGERPRPACSTPRPASDAAFRAEAGRLVRVVIAGCDGDGPYLDSLVVLESDR
jgi:hypothetical protein